MLSFGRGNKESQGGQGQAYSSVPVTTATAGAIEMNAKAKDEEKKTAVSNTVATTIEAPAPKEQPKKEEPKAMSLLELMVVLRPFFWPNVGSDGAAINRLRAMSTYVFVTASKICSLYSPFFLASATNSALDNDWNQALVEVVSYCVLRFFCQVFKEMQSLVYIKVKQQAIIELQALTFAHVHKLSLHWHLTKQTGGVIKSLDRGTDAANTLVTYLFLFLIPAMAECLAVVVLFFSQYKQWELGIVVFAGVTLYGILTVTITQWRKKFRELSNKSDNDFHAKATDSIINFETVKYFTAEQFELKRYSDAVIKSQQYNANTSYSLSFLNLTQQLLLWGTMLGAMLLSTRAVVNGQMSIGAWVAVQSWVNTIFTPLSFLGSIYAAIIQSTIDMRNLSELLNEIPDIVDMPGAKSIKDEIKSKNGVSVALANVNFNYPGQVESSGLQNVNFEVPAGKTVAIVGSTGSGKTTISRMLFRFYDPLKGCVYMDGKDIRHYTQKSLRELIGVVPQDTVLFNDTIMYNIRYGKLDATDEEVYAAAESAQIRSFIDALPERWNTMVGERGLKLSGGEKQRVAIARCLLKNPPVVLLDEATSALDTITEHSIQEALNVLGKNRTVVIIAHRLSTIRGADSIVVMDKGKALEKGSHDELLALNGAYSRLWNMQQTGSIESSPSVSTENDK